MADYWFDPMPEYGGQFYSRLGVVNIGKHDNKEISSNVIIVGASHNVKPWVRVSYFYAQVVSDDRTVGYHEGHRVKGSFELGTGIGAEAFLYRSSTLGLYGYFGVNFNMHTYTNPNKGLGILFGPDGYATDTSTHISKTYGMGGKYYLPHNLFIQAEYLVYNNEGNVFIDVRSLGLGYSW